MKNVIRILNQLDLEKALDSREAMVLHDETCLQDQKDLNALEQRYIALNLTKEQRYLINDYIACLETTKNRIIELSYLAGICDAVLLGKRLKLPNR